MGLLALVMAVGSALLIEVAHANLKVADGGSTGDAAIGWILGARIERAGMQTQLA